MIFRALFPLILFALTSCSGIQVATYKPALPVEESDRPAPMMLSRVRYKLPIGADVGSIGSGWCLLRTQLERGDIGESISQPEMKEAFRDTMQAEGYDVSGRIDLMFDEELDDDMLRSEYRIGAEIMALDSDLCAGSSFKGFWYEPRPGLRGEIYMKVRWHVYDALHRSTVMKTESEGYAKREVPNPEGATLLTRDAFAMAAHNLGADPAFRDLIVHGLKPAKDDAPIKPRPRRYDASDAFMPGDNKILSATPFPRQAEQARRVAVMVQGGVGHGSGFFISSRGDILTNAHVVGDAQNVRIVLSGRDKAMVGEVVKRDKMRDVAWIRPIDPLPGAITVLPVRAEWPGVGERVYAIGAPLQARMQDSVTSGIVSALRKNFPMMGTRQDFIQSDVTIQPGNSGGPLLDANGNIIGFAVAGLMDSAESSTGLNYFIPIASALKTLGIDQ